MKGLQTPTGKQSSAWYMLIMIHAHAVVHVNTELKTDGVMVPVYNRLEFCIQLLCAQYRVIL